MEIRLTKSKSIFLLLNFVIGYMFLYPLIMKFLINIGFNEIFIEDVFYFGIFATYIICAKDVLIDSLNKFKLDYNGIFFRSLIRYLKMFLLMMVINFGLSLILPNDAKNQLEILKLLSTRPLITIFLSCIFAPIVEEIVFREIIFKYIYIKFNYKIAILISGLSFGFIHVYSSLLLGDFLDLFYIISYGIMGMIICIAYKQENNFVGAFMIHFMNNFFAIFINLLAISYL